MTTVSLQLPPQLDETSALKFCEGLFKSVDATQFQFDFSPLKVARPLGTLLLASELQRFFSAPDRSYSGIGIDVTGCAAHSDLAHVGFFTLIGLPVGNKPGEAAENSTHVPIRVLTRSALEAEARASVSLNSDKARLGNSIQRQASLLSALVTGDPRPRVNKQIAYCLREIIRNVFEHGRIDHCIIHARRMPDGYVEAAIVDRGCGILASLSERHTPLTELDAIEAAVQPGVSGAEVRADDGDEWSNSGFGLYVLSELGKRFGSFVLCSGAGELRTDIAGATVSATTHPIVGTAVGLKFRQLKGNKFEAYLQEIVNAGEALAAQQGRLVRASKSTRLSSMHTRQGEIP